MVRRSVKAAVAAALTLCGVVATQAKAVEPKNYGVGAFSCGYHGCPAIAPLLALEPHIDMIRTGNVWHPEENGDFRIEAEDGFLEDLSASYGWNRLLILADNGVNKPKPTIEDLINSRNTGTIQQIAESFPMVEYLQVRNEPGNFNDLTPVQYVQQLRVAWNWIQGENARREMVNNQNSGCEGYVPLPRIKVVSAAFFGNDGGYQQTIAALKAGMAKYCDIIAVHDYHGGLVGKYSALRASLGLNNKPIWITETGPKDFTQQDEWYENEMVNMSRSLAKGYTGSEKQIIFQYQLNGNDGYQMVALTDSGWQEQNTQLFNDLFSRPRTAEPGYSGTSRPVNACSPVDEDDEDEFPRRNADG
jgi:hypothetical protein